MDIQLEIIDEQYNTDQAFFQEKLTPVYEELGLKGAVTIKIGDEEESKSLNFNYRQKDNATDVLSFPLNEELPNGFYLGDIHMPPGSGKTSNGK